MFKKYALKMSPPKYSNSKLITNSLTNIFIHNLTNNAFNMEFFFVIMVLKLILIIFDT